MKKLGLVTGALIVLGLSASCVQPVSGEILKSEKPRITSPSANNADLASLVDGNSAFAFNLYQALKNGEGNLFYSPYSISLALAMTYSGARGETAQQMAAALRFTLPQNNLHPAFNSLDTELAQRGEGAKGKDGKGFRLNIVNAIWGQKGYAFLADFLDILGQNYGAGMRTLDFKNAAEDSRLTINKWVSDQTENRIKDLIAKGAIDAATRLVLTNAIYFNAAWQYPFKEDATNKSGTFNLIDGNKVTVPMMKQTESLNYAEGTGYQAVELPYDGRQLSMVILLPQTKDFKTFESALNSNQIAGIVKDLKSRLVILTMPRFEYDSSFELNKALAGMGMPIAFSEAADFSGMTGKKDLFISDVLHKAFVSVNESGTEAAAATAVIMRTTSLPTGPVEVTLDHPFIFLIRDIKTGALLFVGRVVNPVK